MLVFRHFSDVDQLAAYLRGSWTGSGVHGDPDRPAAAELCRLSCTDTGLQIELEGQSSDHARRSRQIMELPPLSRWDLHIEADYLRATFDLIRLEIQAMDQLRLHLSLYLEGGVVRLSFAGALRREGPLLRTMRKALRLARSGSRAARLSL